MKIDDYLDLVAGRLALLTRTAQRLQDRMNDVNDETIDNEVGEAVLELTSDVADLLTKMKSYAAEPNVYFSNTP